MASRQNTCCCQGVPVGGWVARQRPPPPARRPPARQRRSSTACSASSSTAEDSACKPPDVIDNFDASKMRTGLATAQGPRSTMEDAAHVAHYPPCNFLYASVFDGHGGSAAATFLQQQLWATVCQFLDATADAPDTVGALDAQGLCCPVALQPLLNSCYKAADAAVLAFLDAHAVGPEKHSGCTATTVLVGHDRVIVANVGDSRAVLCRRSAPIDLTVEHRVYGRGAAVLPETERVEAAGGWVHDGRVCSQLAVSRAFGDALFKGAGLQRLLSKGVEDGFWDAEFAASRTFTGDPVTADPDVTEIALQDDDEFVVVATDGLWDVISSTEVCRITRTQLAKGLSPQEVAEKLAEFAVKRYTTDNVAVVVVELLPQDGVAAANGKAQKQKGGGGLFGLFR